MTATLEVSHDGIKTSATVRLGSKACDLDSMIEAATQSDPELAKYYGNLLAQIAPELYLCIDKVIDGSADAGCCWFEIRLKQGINGGTLTKRGHRITRTEFKGWNPTAEQIEQERKRILARANMIGLAQAGYWWDKKRTVAENA